MVQNTFWSITPMKNILLLSIQCVPLMIIMMNSKGNSYSGTQDRKVEFVNSSIKRCK